MVSRRVTSADFPFLPIRITVRGWTSGALALLDTGFSGDLVIPENVLPENIGAPDYPMLYRVADDRITSTGLFYGSLQITGLPAIPGVSIGVLGSKYIIGLGIIERYTVTLDRGEQVIIEM